jgi:putative methyltransferase (TIGR04325 family)
LVSPSEAISHIAISRAFDVACVHALARNGSICQKERQEPEMTRAKLMEDVLPPVVYRLLSRIYLVARGLGWHRFYGCYPTLADVPSDPEGQNSEWYAARASKEVKSLKFELSHRPMGDEAAQLLLPFAVSHLLNGGGATVTVLDFGGGAATGLKRILEHVPNVDLTKSRYVLVETSAMCQAVGKHLAEVQKKEFKGTCSIEVKEEVPTSLPHPLIVHANSSIQYISDYRAALSGLLALAPEIFIVAHTPVSDARTYAQQQLNNPHHRLARWVFNRGRFVSEIEKAGYRLALTFDQDVPATYKMAPGPLTDTSMVFYRSSATINAHQSGLLSINKRSLL